MIILDNRKSDLEIEKSLGLFLCIKALKVLKIKGLGH
jgi:hypothetical protein